MASLGDVPLTATQRDISIAGIVIFSIPLAIHLCQTVRSEGLFNILGLLHKVRPNLLLVFCVVRIVGNALYLAADTSSNSILIGALILESLGSTFLMGEMTRLLVSFLDHSTISSPSDTHFHHHRILRLTIKSLRIPIVVAVILYIIAFNVGSITTYRALTRAGATVLFVVYLLILSICIYTGLELRRLTHNTRSTPFSLLALSLPFLLIRMLYLVLGAFGADNDAFVVIWGDWRIFVSMSLCMEGVIVACLAASTFTDDHKKAVLQDLQDDVAGELVKYEVEEAKIIQD